VLFSPSSSEAIAYYSAPFAISNRTCHPVAGIFQQPFEPHLCYSFHRPKKRFPIIHKGKAIACKCLSRTFCIEPWCLQGLSEFYPGAGLSTAIAHRLEGAIL
jgi:hypothetical protein